MSTETRIVSKVSGERSRTSSKSLMRERGEADRVDESMTKVIDFNVLIRLKDRTRPTSWLLR